MFDNIKLEKGLYNLAGKNFIDALEEIDPSENYVGTPIEKLDAFERQLKRFDIRVNGAHCDKVEKFFTTTETAVLFPEYMKRCIVQGIEDSNIGDIVAVKTIVNATVYKGLSITDTSSYTSTISAGSLLPDSTITESSTTYDIKKFARLINCPYEVIRQQNLDVFGLQLRVIGRKIGFAIYSKALSAITDNASSIDISGSELAYSDLINLFGEFTNYDITTVIASPAICAKILQLDEIADHCCCNNTNGIILPFGARLVKSTMVDDTKILAIDKDFAIEYVTTSDLYMETDKIINRQLESVSVSIPCLFRALVTDAMKVLNLS
ncbi:MAG: hypothetical protein LIO71_01695 [Ruminococcus sp.]|nr:hypothetical protein [Ruminococcus sp.]MCD7799859.1 hypothetical protein [Ruminococcus sp.]